MPQRRRTPRLWSCVVALALLLPLRGAAAQRKVVVLNDEWAASHLGFTPASNGERFFKNVAQWFMGPTGSILFYTENVLILETGGLTSMLSGAGYTLTQTTDPTTSFAGYDAVVVGGGFSTPDPSALVDYVLGGGNVLLLGGTGALVTAPDEAAFWNPFLHRFDLAFDDAAPDFNHVTGNVQLFTFKNQAPFGAALFTGVNQLYQDNGNTIVAGPLSHADVVSQIFTGAHLGSSPPFDGLYAAAQVLPEPSTVALLAGGLAALAAAARRRAR